MDVAVQHASSFFPVTSSACISRRFWSNFIPSISQWSTECIVYSFSVAAFAVDTDPFKQISCLRDISLLQQEISNLVSGVQLRVCTSFTNKAKCKIQTITRQRKPIESLYFMGNQNVTK